MIDTNDSQAHVNIKGEWVPVTQVVFEDISEDFMGFDLMTFTYKGETYKSRIIMKAC